MSGSGWEYQTLKLPRYYTRAEIRERLGIAASFSDWELRRHVIRPDGRREITLRRRARAGEMSEESAPPSI